MECGNVSVNSSMKAIADKIRVLEDTNNSMSLEAMSTHLNSVINEVDTQANYIDLIKEKVRAKMRPESIFGVMTVTPSSNSRSISFSGLPEELTFTIVPIGNITLNSTTRYVLGVYGFLNADGGIWTEGVYSTNSTTTYTNTGFTASYNNGTLTINTTSTSDGGYFRSGTTYQLSYSVVVDGSGDYGSGIATTPSSNSKTITFEGILGEPKMFSVIPLSNMSLSSTTQYVTNVEYSGQNIRGSYANRTTNTHSTSAFSYTYSNGNLTITTTTGSFRSGIQYGIIGVFSTTIGSGTTTTQVKKKRGTFIVDQTSGWTEIDCGFTPDAITIFGGLHNHSAGDVSIYQCSFNFIEDERISQITNLRGMSGALWPGDDELEYGVLEYDIYTGPTNTGFWIYIEGYYGDWELFIPPQEFEYVAIKYA